MQLKNNSFEFAKIVLTDPDHDTGNHLGLVTVLGCNKSIRAIMEIRGPFVSIYV